MPRLGRETTGISRLRNPAARLGTFALLLLCVSCGDFHPEQTVIADGDWGWDEGAGCEGMTDALRIEGDWMNIYRDGEAVDRALMEERVATRRDGTGGIGGAVDGALWTYIGRDPENPSQLVRIQDRFQTSMWIGEINYMILNQRRVIRGREPVWVVLENEPRIGQRLKYCDTSDD